VAAFAGLAPAHNEIYIPRREQFQNREGAETHMENELQVKREIVVEADAETLERMRKEGHARGFTVYCDEAQRTGGDNSAPPPLAYFGLSLAF
jgi:hypothetical protein